MIRFPRALVLGGAVFLILLAALPGLATASDDDMLVQRAQQNLQQENYDEALAQLTEAWERGPHTPQKAFLLGQVNRLMLNYPKAKEYLEEALRIKPDLHPAQLMLADTLIALDQPQDAVPLLQKLEASGYEPGQTAFLLGVTATKAGRYSQALDYFHTAQADPKMAQEATFQASLALAALNRVKEAQKTMAESIALNPQSQTADFAQRYMGILTERAEALRPFHITVSAGYDYDSNISVSPSSPGEVTNISGKGGSVFTQTALMEYTLLPAGPFSILGQYAYFQTFHPTVSGFDVMNHFIGLTPTYGFKNSRFWLPVSWTYMDLQSSKYYTGFLFTPTFLHLPTEHIGIEFGFKYNRQYYTSPVFLNADDRSGKAYGGSFGLYYFFKKQKGFAQLRASVEHNNTTGNNWDSNTYRLLAALLYPITDKWKCNLFLDVMNQPFNNVFYNGATVGNVVGAPLLPQPHRLDQILILGMQTSYEFVKGLEFGVHWYYIRDNSNINLYNYSRHIVGCQFAYHYQVRIITGKIKNFSQDADKASAAVAPRLPGWGAGSGPQVGREEAMRLRPITIVVIFCLALGMGFSSLAGAEVVGRLTEVEGRVDLLKGGNLPAVPVKLDDTVAPKDVIRTKSLSKAQITFIDNSVLTISPESRIAIEEYLIDMSQGKRHAVLEVFQGLALAVVNKIFKVEEPDFVVKTQTAVMGVRGTEFGIRILPNSSTIMNFKGLLQVGNIFPEISQLFLKAFKLAYAFGPLNAQSNQWVFLKNMQATTVGRDLPPTLPYQISIQDREMFMRQLTSIAPQTSKFHQDNTRATAMPTGPASSTSPVSFNNPGEAATLAVLNTITVPPTVVPQTPTPTPTPPPTPTWVAIPTFNILTTWGSGARDLDLHLAQPADGSVFHVYYGNQGSISTFPYAKLNGDNTGTSGSEVITVSQFLPGAPYQATVFNYGDQSYTSTNLSTTSGVNLKVINGGTVVSLPSGGATVTGGTVVGSLTPTPGLAGNTWVAVSINPATGVVTPVNQIINTASGIPLTSTVASSPVATPAVASSAATAITTLR